MKAVAADAHVREFAREREKLRKIVLRSMESRVEASDLRYVRGLIRYDGDGRQIVRLMQGSKRRQGGERGHDAGIKPNRRGEMQAAMNDPVSDPQHRCAVDQFNNRLQDFPHGGAVIHSLPTLPADQKLFRIHDAQGWRQADLFHLTAKKGGMSAARFVDREFDAG
jgi:hypothetical protein